SLNFNAVELVARIAAPGKRGLPADVIGSFVSVTPLSPGLWSLPLPAYSPAPPGMRDRMTTNGADHLLHLHHEIVQPGWVDYNDHLNDGYFMVIFSNATTALMDHIGLGAEARAATGCTLFTLETHINYLREVKGGAEARIDTQILGHDQKRLHVFHTM